MAHRKYDTPQHRKAQAWVKGKACVRCGSTNNIQADHVIDTDAPTPLSGYQPLCRSCNVGKANRKRRKKGTTWIRKR